MAEYKEITCASALHKLKHSKPYDYDMNIYRGCEHGCRYCFALYSHDYMGSDKYFDDIYVKTNIPSMLEKQLSSRYWNGSVINIGGVTDSYQPCEAKYKLMPEILKILIKYKNPCIISTKSDLILRDFELLEQLSRVAYVGVAATITCGDETIRQKIEPNGAPSRRRFEMLQNFSKTNVITGLHCMPIIPFLTDSDENIDWLFENAEESGVSYVIPDILNLRGRTKYVFMDFIHREYLSIYAPLSRLYTGGPVSPDYKKSLYKKLNEKRKVYGLSFDYMKPLKNALSRFSNVQLSLFDDQYKPPAVPADADAQHQTYSNTKKMK